VGGGGGGEILWNVSILNPQRGTGNNIGMDFGQIICEDGKLSKLAKKHVQ
jgi:hypothetical protein